MAAITVDRSGRVRVNGVLFGHVRDGVVTERVVDPSSLLVVQHSEIGTIDRSEAAGPRGGTVVEWVAHSPLFDISPVFGSRAAAVVAIVGAWLSVPESVESAPVESDPTNTVPLSNACAVCVSVDGDCLCTPPVRAIVTDYRAGDYVEVDIAGDVHVFTWSDDRGVRRNYLVVIDGHADYGDFTADPAGWVQRYYRDEGVDVVNVSPCPCGGSYVDGVCSSCDSCSGCAECAPKHSYAGSVSHEVLSVDVQRHAAYLDAPASIVAHVRVRYSFPDAPGRVHCFLFSSNEDEPRSVRMTSAVPSGTGLVTVYNPARFGSFSDDPVSWVHSFYA